jgi:predicted small secreted protein
MKKKIYLIFLLVAVAIMTSSNTGCGGNDAKTSGDTTKKSAHDASKKDTTHTIPTH